MPASLDKLSLEFRSAVLAADYSRAGRLAPEYAGALKETWMSLSESERARSILPRQARELFTWARAVTGVQRVLAAGQLAILEKATRYQPAGLSTRPSSSIDVRI
jgi:hypothetical protein